MDGTYQMLAAEHHADLEREAIKRRLADHAGPRRRPLRLEQNTTRSPKARKLLRALVAPLRAREAHADG